MPRISNYVGQQANGNGNGNGNGFSAPAQTATAPQRQAAKPPKQAPTQPVPQQSGFDAVAELATFAEAMEQNLGVKLPDQRHNERIAVYYTIRDYLRGRYSFDYKGVHGENAKFPWSTFDGGFEWFFGTVDNMNYTVKQMVLMAMTFMPGIPQDPYQALTFIIQANQASLNQRRIVDLLDPSKKGNGNNSFKAPSPANAPADETITPISNTPDDAAYGAEEF